MKTEKEIIREQEKYIQEMEHYISILEEANAQQKQTIEMLEQHNTVLQQHYEQITTLQYRCRCLSKQVEDFKSGEKYRQMEKAYKELLRFHNKEVKRLEYEFSKAHSETVTVRKYWSEVMDDFEKEHGKDVYRLLTENKNLKKENLRLTIQCDEAIDHYRERNREYYAVASELLEEKEKNKKLTAQVNRDFENSSIPSSLQKAGRKKIPNSRERTGRRSGGHGYGIYHQRIP